MMNAKLLCVLLIMALAACVRPPLSETSCEEYCMNESHTACIGHWEISGEYPDCNCVFECESQNECIGQSAEVHSGEKLECCEGLSLIPAKSPEETSIVGYCTSECGNGLCDNMIESPHNCPQDCFADENTGTDENKNYYIRTEEDAKEENQQQKLLPAEFETSWPTFQGNDARTGFSESNIPSEAKEIWRLGILNFDDVWPVVSEKTVFFASEKVFAVDLESGKEKWVYSESHAGFYPRGLCVGKENVFVTSNKEPLDSEEGEDGASRIKIEEGLLYALNKETGNFLWEFKTEKGISHSLPLCVGKKVFVGDDSGKVYAVSAESGELVWKKRLSGAEAIHSSPAFDENLLFIGTENDGARHNPSYLYAINPENGEIEWRFEIDVVPNKLNLVHAAPAVLNGVVYFGSENGYFYAVDSKDGKLVWKKKIASSGMMPGVSASAALGYGKVFVGTWEGKFFALSQEDGSIIWQKELEGTGTDSSAVVADEKVCFGSNAGQFYCLKEDSGETIWKSDFKAVSPALASGILIVQNAEKEGDSEQSAAIIALSERTT